MYQLYVHFVCFTGKSPQLFSSPPGKGFIDNLQGEKKQYCVKTSEKKQTLWYADSNGVCKCKNQFNIANNI